MSTHFDRIQNLFVAALDKPPADRGPFLNEACAGDTDARQEVEKLLDAHFEASGPLDRAAIATIDMPPVAEKPGTQIGPYKLLQQIGEGGFGVVYMAEQHKPVRRKVALKIIKPGMDTKEVIARFEAERQALALMDHPNIAKVLDAGTTGEPQPSTTSRDRQGAGGTNDVCWPNPLPDGRGSFGRPYFVMELVRGVPITEFCDEQKLPTRERLKLFIDVCRAIQHAHQKGIIHRDLKPTNVMVTLSDGRPISKVIDFGISKALSQQLTEKTLFTAYGQMVGTPLYMSPEQAEMSMHDVDTRSDVYSLGVLLYELLTGTTPFDKDTLQKSGFDEMRRIIREVDPPRPSARVSTLQAEMLSTVSDKRKIDPRKLSQSLRGELDWIVMKALEKDRNRRYESASEFAADVERFLADEPVQARPASVWYRFGKFARRKKMALVISGLIAVILLTFTGGLGWMARDREARRTRLAGQVELILDDVERLIEQQKWPEALATAERAQTVIDSGDADDEIRQQVCAILKDLRFIDRLEQIRMEGATVVGGKFDNARTDQKYARAFREYGVDVETLSVAAAVKRLNPNRAAAVPIAIALDDWADARRKTAKQDRADWKRLIVLARRLDREPLRDHLRKQWGRAVSPEVRGELKSLARPQSLRGQPPATLCLLGRTLRRAGLKNDEVSALRSGQKEHPGDFWINFELASALDTLDPPDARAIVYYSVARGLRPRNPAVLNNLGVAFKEQGKLDEAIASYRNAIKLDPKYAAAHSNLGGALEAQGKLDAAIACYRQAIELDPRFARAHSNLGVALKKQGKLDEAVASYRKAIKLDPKDAVAHSNLGGALVEQNKLDEAVASCRQAIELDPKLAVAHSDLGEILRRQGKLSEAVACLRQAIKLNPKNSGAYNSLGIALAIQQKPDEAVASFRQAIKLNPKNNKAHYNLGITLANQQKLDEAVASYRQAVKLDPKLAVAHNNLGVALQAQGKLDAAIASFRKVIELDPKFVGAHINLSVALDKQGKLDEAIASYRKVVELAPKLVGAHISLGVALKKQGKLREAIACWRKAIGLAPKDLVAHNELAWLRATCADPKYLNPAEALKYAKRAAELAPKSGSITNTLGVARYRNGDWKAAIAALQKSMELRKGGDGSDYFFLAMSHWQLGKKAQARQWYDKAVAWMQEHKPEDEELLRFRAEAQVLMGLRQPVATPRPKRPAVAAAKPTMNKQGK